MLALAILSLTVGLIRSESAGDLRTLTATGADSSIRRTLTATTARALALLGALLGVTGACRPFLPLLSDTFFTVDAQRDRLTVSDHVYGILDADCLAGTITLSNLVGDPFKSATVGYWVDDARRGRGRIKQF